MKSPFRSRKASESHPTAGEESVAVSAADHPHHRPRTETTNSWPGTFGQEPLTPQAKPLLVTKLVYEEGANVVLYLLGSTVLHIVVRVATESMSTTTMLTRRSSTMISLQSLLQAYWLYLTSITSASPVATNIQPILSARIASWRLGRLRLPELALGAVTHAAILLSHAWISSNVLKDDDKVSLSMTGFLQTTLQAICCAVLLLVGPTLLQINRLPPTLVILLLRPPSLMYEHPSRIPEILASQVLAGFLAGKVLARVFPDDPVVV